jgi:RNA polymerase sigma-70 factor (ECF subfamily)
VRAAQAGNRQAFGEIVRRYERLVFSIALRRLANHAEAQEIVQEVFLQVLRKLDQLRTPEALSGWLRQITVRRISNRVSRRGPVTATDPERLDASCVVDETPLTSALQRERQSQVRAGLERLGRLDRETLEAFYVDGQSLIEMSAKFASPIGTIKRRLHVARKRLARELEDLAVA